VRFVCVLFRDFASSRYVRSLSLGVPGRFNALYLISIFMINHFILFLFYRARLSYLTRDSIESIVIQSQFQELRLTHFIILTINQLFYFLLSVHFYNVLGPRGWI